MLFLDDGMGFGCGEGWCECSKAVSDLSGVSGLGLVRSGTTSMGIDSITTHHRQLISGPILGWDRTENKSPSSFLAGMAGWTGRARSKADVWTNG